jgi:2-keto-4-pentenoate hydratase
LIRAAQPQDERAAHLVAARLQARALPDYPGAYPVTMPEAYAIQDAAIDLWPDEVAGWKVGLVPAEQRSQLGAERIAGPIFMDQIQRAGREPLAVPVFGGGFAAIEAEFVFRISRDAPPSASWTPEAAADYVDALFAGVENAGSPFAAINDRGAAVTASDFGNNAGLVLASEIPDWRATAWESLTAVTTIDGEIVGQGDAARIPGGPLAALAFMFENAAARGRPLRKGQYVSTGAVTGVHEIKTGARVSIDFGRHGTVRCIAIAATPRARDRAPVRRADP